MVELLRLASVFAVDGAVRRALLKGAVDRRVTQDSRHTAMILTQVHLRKPCYDFYFLEVIKFVTLPARDATPESAECRAQSVGLTKPLNR